ncbi:hypothetical protein GCM10011344_24810 [Dokdonia pacifica]|uniref:NfeD-like C-terminal, partner-binding n=1 Tax=Dokdonia pacifica TaxID=1627892 RepID=A0A238WSE0_9FLAO|nr:hypothetical protein [Dokdonia pacifica]GGG23129.1 hypothetical protein GCM10011344_24810 [Dokdonia pacifica]SNR48599.1 hypothetical protein SAMN06265376_1011311 [Dokdonia pacifica]
MQEWYSALSSFEQVFWGIALIASVFFVFVLVTTLLGGDADGLEGDVDAEIEGDTGIGFQFFSFKNLVAFFTIFGWSGISFLEAGMSKGIVVLLASACGLAMMFVMAFLLYQMRKMTSSGTLKMKNAIGQIGSVYLTIGANRSRIGKVQITVQGALRELEALTDENEEITTNTVVQVKEVTANGILIVSPTK